MGLKNATREKYAQLIDAIGSTSRVRVLSMHAQSGRRFLIRLSAAKNLVVREANLVKRRGQARVGSRVDAGYPRIAAPFPALR